MGLDITAYTRLHRLNAARNEDGEAVDLDSGEVMDYDAYCIPYINPDFKSQAKGLEEKVVYGFDDRMSFRAGSYSGYNQWRSSLARLAGYGSAEQAWESGRDSGPFWELINFSDCEGAIGAEVSAKLAKDFADFQPQADKCGAWFLESYKEWRVAFEMAADNGFVAFH